MTDRLHNALKSEVLGTTSVPNFQLALVKLQWGKEDIGYSLHISTNTWISSGIQGKTYLQHLGLSHCACSFLQGECWAKAVSENFDLSAFASTLDSTFNGLREVEKKLEACGLRLVDDHSGRSLFGRGHYGGDGHTSTGTPNKMKESSDEHFDFVFTFQEDSYDKGWTTHRHPKGEMTAEFKGALAFLGIHHIPECPQFDFEKCWWSFTPYTGDDFRDGNANWAHAAFGAHEANFTAAVHQLVSINEALKAYGLALFEPYR